LQPSSLGRVIKDEGFLLFPTLTYDTLRVDKPGEFDDDVIDNCEINPSKNESPSKSQRRRGEGSGSIHCKPIKRGNKTYPQYWYH
jgi:hypothetical protein